MITVLGYADRIEDHELGWKRARAASVALTDAGVPANKIYVGAADFPPPTTDTDDVANQTSRKIAITPRFRSDGRYENECIDAIHRSCFRLLDPDQQHDCENGLYLLAPAAGHIATNLNGMPLFIY